MKPTPECLSMELPIPDSPYEIELTNNFSLDLVIQGFVLKEPNGRKSYVKGKTIRWNVTSDDFTMDVLMDGLTAELRVGRDQSIAVWYFNMIMAQDVRLTENDQFHVMFNMYKAERKLALAIVVLDSICSETLVPMLDNGVHVPEPTIPDNDVLLVGFQGCPLTPSKVAASNSTSPLKQFEQVAPSAAVIETDPFDIVEEYVGVDDEYLYDVHADVSATCVEKGSDIHEEDDYADVAHHEEEEVNDIDPAGYSVVHDPENPDIRVGALFPDRKFRHHMNIIKEANPAAIEYLDMYHHRLWYRCGFGEASKVDYLTNNISESFNKQIKDFKGLNVCNLFDRIRELVMEKFCVRRQISEKLNSRILPHVIKQLNALSKTIGRNKILWSTEHEAEVTLLDLKFVKRHIVNLQNRTCTCRVWQVSGKPCMHALAFICSINGAEIQKYVDDYYSVEKFKAAYVGRIPSMTDKSQWINVDLGFKVHPPLQKAVAGRPRVQRIRGWLEPGRKIVKCKRCKEPGHMEKTCKVPDPKYVAVDDDIHEGVPDPSTPTTKRKKDDETAATTDGHVSDDEILINLIRKKARTTPQKPNTPAKKKTPIKRATSQEKAKNKTPVKKVASQEKVKKKTPVTKHTVQEKAKKKTPVKKSKKNVPFAPVLPPPPPPPPTVQPTFGAKRSLLYWLGG